MGGCRAFIPGIEQCAQDQRQALGDQITPPDDGGVVKRCQDIQEHERDNEPDERILLSDSFAAEQISVQPTLYVMCIGHYHS